jgi:predicted SAM-dependent methyltransferase
MHAAYKVISRYGRILALRRRHDLKLYYGCGTVRQDGYVHVDIRYTPAVDLIADLSWCARWLPGRCSEVYLSHVLEHYRSPGKQVNRGRDSVLGALIDIARMLHPGGVVRIAVPDFANLVRVYREQGMDLYPRLLGRLCGEQNYPENLHRCLFDRPFLTWCLQETGFVDIRDWQPQSMGLARDGSFDELAGIGTSLNLLATKPDSAPVNPRGRQHEACIRIPSGS